MKIYTKTGDLGQTSLLGGTRVSKSHERVEAYGTIDELNSFLGLIKDQPVDDYYKILLTRIQENLFVAEAWIAADPDLPAPNLPPLPPDEIQLLENEIDTMNKELPDLSNFILPGGHPAVSFCHVARTVCRRAERCVIRLNQSNLSDEIIIKYLNRLSDYLFVLARKVGKDLGADENPWITLR
jgi:cob(I)alamin adenosyltransferase